MKHTCRTKHAICLLVILLLCLSMLLSSCIRLQKKTVADSDTNSVAEKNRDEDEDENENDGQQGGQSLGIPSGPDWEMETEEDVTRNWKTVGGKTPSELYEYTQHQLETMERYELRETGKITISGLGIDETLNFWEHVCKGSKSAYIKSVSNGELSEAWYVDDLFYYRYYDEETSEQKLLYTDWTLEEFLMGTGATFEFGVDWFDHSDIVFKSNSFYWDGSHYIVEATVKEDAIDEFFVDLSGFDDASINLSLAYNALAKLQTMTIEWNASYTYDGVTATMHLISTVEFIGINQSQTSVEPPVDAYNYQYQDET